MSKLTHKIDSKAILNRMKEKSGFSSDKELAKYLDLKPQAISNIRNRNSIDISNVILYVNKSRHSVGYILYGKDELIFPLNADTSITVKSPVGFSKKWLQDKFTAPPSDIRYYSDKTGKYFLIDTSAKGRCASNGKFLFFVNSEPMIRYCQLSVSGSVTIEGEVATLNTEEFCELDVVGKVISHFSAA